jgi:hypothetical protein
VCCWGVERGLAAAACRELRRTAGQGSCARAHERECAGVLLHSCSSEGCAECWLSSDSALKRAVRASVCAQWRALRLCAAVICVEWGRWNRGRLWRGVSDGWRHFFLAEGKAGCGGGQERRRFGVVETRRGRAVAKERRGHGTGTDGALGLGRCHPRPRRVSRALGGFFPGCVSTCVGSHVPLASGRIARSEWRGWRGSSFSTLLSCLMWMDVVETMSRMSCY